MELIKLHNNEIEQSQQEIAKNQSNIAKHQKAIGLCLEKIEIFDKSRKEKNGPFLLVDNTKSKVSKISVQNGGTDTMRKNCYRRPDGRWEYSKQMNGLKYYAIANTYRELLTKIERIEPKQVRNVIKISAKVRTFAQYFQFYIDNYIKNKNYGKSTLDEWNRTLRQHILKNFNKIAITKLTTESIQVMIDKIDKERLRQKVFQKVVRVLQKAYMTGVIKKDITLPLEKPKRKNVNIRSSLTYDEQVAFLEEIKKTNLYVYAMFLLIVGCRRDEAINFDMQKDLNEAKHFIQINGTKTMNAKRKVYVSQGFIDFLKQNLPKGKFKFSSQYATHIIGEALKKIGTNKCLHCLRHTCSANLYFLGAKDKFRQMQLGHASITTTNDIYTHIEENIPKSKLLELYGDLYPRFDETFDETFFTN